MKIKTAYSSLTLACIAAMGLSVAIPASAADGVIIGSVKDAAQTRSYTGAQIKLKELGLVTEAGTDGTFRFPSIPEGTYTLEISYLGEETVTQAIKVTDNGIAHAERGLRARTVRWDCVCLGSHGQIAQLGIHVSPVCGP